LEPASHFYLAFHGNHGAFPPFKKKEGGLVEENFIVRKDGKNFVDITKVLPDEIEGGRKIFKLELGNGKVEVFVQKHAGQGGHDSKRIVLNRYLELDEFFFENLGLWQGDGGKHKGLYFGNTCLDILLSFLKFSEERLGIERNEFHVTVSSPFAMDTDDIINSRWSKNLTLPFSNFTKVCRVGKINMEYAQMYVNGIIIAELMNRLYDGLREAILESPKCCASIIRGIFAAEGQVALKEWGTIAYVSITCGTEDDICWYKKFLETICIASGKYQESTCKFPVSGRDNLENFEKWKIHILHPKKRKDFERGMSNYQRRVEHGDVMEKNILDLLGSSPKTYDEISCVLDKGRSTIQSHYIPILESKGLIKRKGKRGRAWLFEAA
jgi:hypothetical protein